MKDKVIGLPRSLLFYTYKDLWINFFNELNIKYIISPITNKEILETGIKLSNSESCLPLKIHMGHVSYLINKCDYILIPRIWKLEKNEVVCTNFNALYDITKNTFSNAKIIDFNLDYRNGNYELKEFIKLGNLFGYNSYKSMRAYIKAKNNVKKLWQEKRKEEEIKFKSDKKKILIISHEYNAQDNLIGKEVERLLNNKEIVTIVNPISEKNLYKEIMPTLYFSFHKPLVSSVVKYKDLIDAIIVISSFPCGIDALVFDMLKRKIKDKPIIHIEFDEFTSNTGLITRIESIIDIIKEIKV